MKTVWVHVYLHPRDVNYFRARLERSNIERLVRLSYRVEPEGAESGEMNERAPGSVGQGKRA